MFEFRTEREARAHAMAFQGLGILSLALGEMCQIAAEQARHRSIADVQLPTLPPRPMDDWYRLGPADRAHLLNARRN